ncbi:hypothetical protein [Candidatus Poriferisodalis sp.]|uniref:hypothetical protein n=1 Tax=Candidatus Poriferisodalis sp. TaxID=3101277 RepID=UPI003B012B5F
MPMRTNCRHYESRTYPNGDTVRKCNLDLAPEAPWRCPEDCPSYSPRRLDAGWQHGSLGVQNFAKEPASIGEDDSIAALLDAAEDVVNAAGPRILEEVAAERSRHKGLRAKARSRKAAKKKRRARRRQDRDDRKDGEV